MPEGTGVVWLGRGGTMLQIPEPGDAVELFADTPDGKGKWVSGFYAVSGIQRGAMGGEFDGEDVMLVSKTPDGPSAEWPVQCVRLPGGWGDDTGDTVGTEGGDNGSPRLLQSDTG